MTSNTEAVAAKIVKAVITDLSDRSGFDHWWDDIDSGIRAEIRRELKRKVLDVLVGRAGMP